MSNTVRRVMSAALPLVLTLCACTHAAAQPNRLTPREVGQIVNAVLNAVVPDTGSLSRVPVTQRKLFFDFDRTLAAFGYGNNEIGRESLELKRSVIPGAESMLADCEQVARKSCQGLGWGVYIFVRPVNVTSSDALVRARVMWADRGSSLVPGVAPSGPANLVGFSLEVFLSRGPDGTWKFVRTGKGIAS